MNQQQMDMAISKAQALMSQEGQRLIESHTPSGKKRMKGSSDLSALERQVGFGGYSSRQEKEQAQTSTMNAIQESFSQTPALSGNGFPQPYAPGQSLINETRQYQQQPVYQQPVYQQPVYQQPQGMVDYNMIKYLVSEAIKENLCAIKQSLNESTLRGMKIGEGNKFQFLDMKGNLYEGTMTLKKKAQ